MDTDLVDVVGIIGAIIAVLVALGGGAALVRGSYNKARIEALRGDNEDLRLRSNDQGREIERLLLQQQSDHQRIEHLENENRMLMDMVTQRAEVAEVAAKLDRHHREVMEKYDDMIAAIRETGL